MDLIKSVKGTQKLQSYVSKETVVDRFKVKKMCKNQYLIHKSKTTYL